jgi:autotransporter-associated beta strand protein
VAVRTWTGAVSNLWNVAGNWDTLPTAGDDLVFPLTASNKSNSNDFAADTAFNSITIHDLGYTLAGNRITLGAGGITQTTGYANTIQLAIVLGSAVTVNVEGILTINGIISDGVGSAVTKVGTGQLVMNAANTFTGGLIVKAGTCYSNSTNGFGDNANVITIGDSSGGSANATLSVGLTGTYTNPIIVASGSSGLLSINHASASNCILTGLITLANNLTITQTNASSYLFPRGGTVGIGNLTFAVNSGGYITASVGSINHTGTITNSGTGTGTTTISAVIGTNVTGVIQNSTTSQLTLSGANTFTSGLTIKAGTCSLSTSTSAGGGSGTGTITLGDTSGTANATLGLASSLTFANPVTVVAGSSGTLTIQTSSNPKLTGEITLANDVTLYGNNNVLQVQGGIVGTGNVILKNAGEGTVWLETVSPNHIGTITNIGGGTGIQSIFIQVGVNVTAVIQSSNTTRLTLQGAGTIANCADKFQITSGELFLANINTVANLYVDATTCTDKTAQLTIRANQTVTGELKLRGSVANRLLCTSDTLGTARTLTITGATISNNQAVDFRGIAFANGGSNVDLSAIAGGSGDCGGNTISGGGVLSFTTADDWYWYSASGGIYNLSDRTYWFTATNGGGTQMPADRGPLPQDMLYVDGSSINGTTTIDQDMPRMPGIDFTGCDPVAFHMDNVNQSCYGSLLANSSVTVALSVSFSTTMIARSSVLLSMPSATGSSSATLSILTIGGSVTLASNLVEWQNLRLTAGLLDAATYNTSCVAFFCDSTTYSRELRMGSGIWIVRSSWAMATGNLVSTIVGDTSTIVWNAPAVRFFSGAGCTYHNLTIASTAYDGTIQGNNTFTGTLTINGPKTINFTAGSVQTVSAFATTGTGIVLKSTSAGSPWYLVDPSGTNQVSNCTISDSYPRGSDAGGGALWLASDGTNTDAGGNVAYDGATNRGWKWTGFAPWLMRRRRRMAGAR